MTDAQILRLSSRKDVILAVVQCHEFDHHATVRLKTELAALTARNACRPVVLDLSNVQFLASMTLGVLVEASKSFSSIDRSFCVVGLSKNLREMMQSFSILHLFDVCDTVEDVLREV